MASTLTFKQHIRRTHDSSGFETILGSLWSTLLKHEVSDALLFSGDYILRPKLQTYAVPYK